jgi:signal peptidase I
LNKSLRIIANAVLVVCVAALLAVLVAPRLMGLTLEPVLSGSMEPTIRTGALIAIGKSNPEMVQVGDIIGFHVQGMDTPVCHRVIEVIRDGSLAGFRTKGDANEDPDSWVVKPADLIGTVYFNISWLGTVAKFVKTPQGFFLLMGVPALAVVAIEIRDLFWPRRVTRKRPDLRRRTSHRPGRAPLLVPVVGGLILTAALWAAMAGSSTEKSLGSMANSSGSSAGTGSAQTTDPGETYSTERTIQNKGLMPLVICFASSDSTVTISERCFSLSPGKQNKVSIEGSNASAAIRTAGYLPLLPRSALYRLFIWNPRVAPIIAIAVWVVPLTVCGIAVARAFSTGPALVSRAKILKAG